MNNGFIGEIKLFAGNFAPQGWALCNGAPMLIRQNPALYSIVGTTYGGDGITTFNLPNLAGVPNQGSSAVTNYIIAIMGDFPMR